MSSITYICCVNNSQQLNDMLLPSLNRIKEQGGTFNFIQIDAKSNGYKSAAESFNSELDLRKNEIGDIIVFLHQDIAFDDSKFHNYVIKTLEKEPNTIIGVAGSFAPNMESGSNLKYFKNKEYIQTPINQALTAYAVDECCFAMTKETFFRQMFDERACPYWHLYASDFCYYARLKYNAKIIISPISIYHKLDANSGLGVDILFLKTLWNLVKKYHKNYPKLYVTCYATSTNFIIAFIKLNYSYLKGLFMGRPL